MDVELPVSIRRQPDYTTCGPTSLHALYTYYGDPIPLEEVIAETAKVPGGGTVGVHLAVHALRRGYKADMWVCNVQAWDPTWFQAKVDLAAKLEARAAAKGLLDDPRYGPMITAAREYLDRGGRVRWRELTPRALGAVLGQGHPLMAGTNGTYLYQAMRETSEGPDDVKGDPFGHFLVVCGYRSKDMSVSIADPLKDNPLTGSNYYRASVYRLIGAIFLGSRSDDGNLLVIQPSAKRAAENARAAAAAGKTVPATTRTP
jgi:hypothetical protein